MYYNKNTTVFLDGQWLKAGNANASLFNQTMHYGFGVFEGIRSYDTPDGVQIFKAQEHYERLKYSAKKMHINFNYSVQELTKLTYQLLEKNNLTDAYIRPLVYLGQNMRLSPTSEVHLFLCAWKWEKYLGSQLLSVITSSLQRPNPKSVPVDAKVTGHYANSILATTEAQAKGFDEALLLDINGNVAEGSGANFFYEKDGVLFTSPLGNILPGITRQTTFELAKELGVEVKETHFKPEQVHHSDGAFFTGTATEIAGIKSLDGISFKLPWEETLGYQLSKMYTRRVSQNEYMHFELV
ncbi:MAG: branched-chain amino acid transaminase [Flavobacteriales bacterium]|nr:branched-chain amino acid transaminase [Flavobacteriales bacterium]